MTKKEKNRQELIAAINEAGRNMSTATILFHQAVAEKAGLSGTDHKYLDLLFQEGSMTAGEFAEKTNLTTGAVTGIVDRLEKQGLVKRERQSDDRRKVFITLREENAYKKLGPIFDSLQHDLEQFYKKFNKEELNIILKYLTDTITLFQKKAENLQNSTGPADKK